jgi:MarR family transcriptional regulator, transcriptional regulator for hemolysin
MEQTIGRMLYLAHRAVHDELDRRLHEHGASLWNWLLLDKAANADDASQRELAELMRIEPPTLVRHLDKLADEGLVERRPDPADRRVLRVVVTDAGHARLTELRKVVHEFDDLRGILTKRDAEVLGRALPRIHAYFDQDDRAQVPPGRARRAGGETESTQEEEMQSGRARRAGGETESTQEEEMQSGRARRAGGETESTQEEVSSGR